MEIVIVLGLGFKENNILYVNIKLRTLIVYLYTSFPTGNDG